MKLLLTIAGGLIAIATAVLSAPGSAGAMPFAPAAAIALRAEIPPLTEKTQYRRYYDPRIRCIRAPCYVQRYHRPRYVVRHRYRPRYYGSRVVCRIRYGYGGPRRVCRRAF